MPKRILLNFCYMSHQKLQRSWKLILIKEPVNRLSKKHKGYENELEKRRLKKWKKIQEKPRDNHTNSLKTTYNNTYSYSTESQQQEQGSGKEQGH